MSFTYHARGIVLRRGPWRDAARIYTFYTREHGKILAVGRGTRKVLSKLAAHLEPYSTVDLHLARGRRSETVCGARLVRASEALAADHERHLMAAFVAEAADQLVRPGERDLALWDLIDAALRAAAEAPQGRLPSRLAAFVWSFMDRLGYRPKLEACASCERPAGPAAARFLPLAGAVVCVTCDHDERALVGAQPLRPDDLLSLQAFFGTGEVQEAPALPVALAFLEAHLDRPLVTLEPVRAAIAPTRHDVVYSS